MKTRLLIKRMLIIAVIAAVLTCESWLGSGPPSSFLPAPLTNGFKLVLHVELEEDVVDEQYVGADAVGPEALAVAHMVRRVALARAATPFGQGRLHKMQRCTDAAKILLISDTMVPLATHRSFVHLHQPFGDEFELGGLREHIVSNVVALQFESVHIRTLVIHVP